MINHITIQNYRNIQSFSNDLSSAINYIIAPNASGKTNFLESIYYSVFGSTFRNQSSNGELIGPAESFAKVQTSWNNTELELVVASTESKITRKFMLNKKAISYKKLPSKFGVILFAPHTVDLTSREPSVRRKDLDDFLSICYEKYFALITRYSSVLRNRNALLKNLQNNKSSNIELSYWTNEIVKIGTEIYKFRYQFFQEIESSSQIAAKEIYRSYEDFRIAYLPNLNVEPENFASALLEKYKENEFKEIIVGRTLYGVHKDDFKIEFNQQDLRYFGSRGQQRIGGFILKLSQIVYFQKLKNYYPIFLIDDIMSELDTEHRAHIAESLLKLPTQLILTGADKSEIPEILRKKSTSITLAEK